MNIEELGLTPEDIAESSQVSQSIRYKALEDRAYNHIEFIQLALDAAMNARRF